MRFLALLPFILLVGFFAFVVFLFSSVRREKEALRKDLAGRACPGCGSEFGDAAALEAEESWNRYSADLIKNNQNKIMRLEAIWPVTCKNCGWKGNYKPSKRELLPNNETAVNS